MPEDAYPESSWNRIREWKAIPGGKKMHTKEAIKFALTVSDRAVLSVIDEMSGSRNDVSDAEWRVPPALGAGSSHAG